MIVVDFNQTAISNLMAELRGRTDVEVNVPLLRHMIINAIRGYRNRFHEEYGEIVIACDNRRYWRRDVFPHYKASRKKARESSGYDWPSIFDALHMIRNELDEYFPYPFIDIDGAEADDIIGTLAEYSQTQTTPGKLFDEAEPFLIISGDHAAVHTLAVLNTVEARQRLFVDDLLGRLLLRGVCIEYLLEVIEA